MLQRRIALVVASTVLMGTAAPLKAQEECELSYRGNFRLNGAQQYLRNADRSSYEPDKLRHADNALRVVSDAIRQGSGYDETTAWTFLGQAYAIRQDLVGADSAWTRARATASPACQREIDRKRFNVFVPLNNVGLEHMAAQRYDSALVAFRRAALIMRTEPALYINMGSIFLQMEQDDSAVAAFRHAAVVRSDSASLENRANAMFNAARILHRNGELVRADTVYREYLQLRPQDNEARAALAGVLNQLGRRSEATAIYDEILSHADSLSSFDLFDVGVALFRQAQLDTVAADSTIKLELFGKAAQAFEAGLRKNPSHRDALYNLTNTYIATNDTARALASARRLVEIDPQNGFSLRLLAAAYQRYALGYDAVARRAQAARDAATVNRLRPLLMAYQDSTLQALALGDSLAWEVQVSRFEPRDSSAVLNAAVSNHRQAETPAFDLVFEFVNGAGEIVARETVNVPTLGSVGGPGALYDFSITASGRGIIAYRYRRAP